MTTLNKIFKILPPTSESRSYPDVYHSVCFKSEFKGVKLVAILRYYDYAEENLLVCIDRDDCFNKESQCPIIFLWEELGDKAVFLDYLEKLCREGGEEFSNSWYEDSNPEISDHNHCRLRFYNEIWDVDSYIEERNKKLGIDFKKEFPDLDWQCIAKLNSREELQRVDEDIKKNLCK